MNAVVPSPLPIYAPEEFQRVVDASVCAMDHNLSELDSFHWTRFGGVSFGDIDVFRNEGFGVRRGSRRAHHIRQDSVRDIHVFMPRDAFISLRQNGTTVHLEPGTFAFSTTTIPYDFEVAPLGDGDHYSMIHARVASDALRQRVPYIDACCLRRLELRPGATRIMLSMLESALTDGGALSEARMPSFSGSLIDAIANAVLDMREFARLGSVAMTPRQRVRDSAIAFIQKNLAEPSLDVRAVAAHCNVSLRYLHVVFAESGRSVGALLRENRLQKCRGALRDPLLCDRSVTEIALAWGFNDPSSFCRAYKNMFGVTPSMERCHSRRGD